MKKHFENEPADFDVDPAQVAIELQDAKWVLGWLGASNLSDIEVLHLRKDIEQSLRERACLYKKYAPEGLSPSRGKDFDTIRMNKTIAFEEAVAKFLMQYGIDMAEVNFKFSQNVPLGDQIIMDAPGRAYITKKLAAAREEAHKPFLD